MNSRAYSPAGRQAAGQNRAIAGLDDPVISLCAGAIRVPLPMFVSGQPPAIRLLPASRRGPGQAGEG